MANTKRTELMDERRNGLHECRTIPKIYLLGLFAKGENCHAGKVETRAVRVKEA